MSAKKEKNSSNVVESPFIDDVNLSTIGNMSSPVMFDFDESNDNHSVDKSNSNSDEHKERKSETELKLEKSKLELEFFVGPAAASKTLRRISADPFAFVDSEVGIEKAIAELYVRIKKEKITLTRPFFNHDDFLHHRRNMLVEEIQWLIGRQKFIIAALLKAHIPHQTKHHDFYESIVGRHTPCFKKSIPESPQIEKCFTYSPLVCDPTDNAARRFVSSERNNPHGVPGIGHEFSRLWFGDHCLQVDYLPLSTAWVFFKYFEGFFDYCSPFVQEHIQLRRNKNSMPNLYCEDFYRYEVAERIFAFHSLGYIGDCSQSDLNPYSNPNIPHEEFHELFQKHHFNLAQEELYPVLEGGCSAKPKPSLSSLNQAAESAFYESYDCETEVEMLVQIRAWFVKCNNCMLQYTKPITFPAEKVKVAINSSLPPNVCTIAGVPDFAFPTHYREFVPQYNPV
jgi:hypothetical protein